MERYIVPAIEYLFSFGLVSGYFFPFPQAMNGAAKSKDKLPSSVSIVPLLVYKI